MFEYINGEITQLTPTYAVIEANGIGYLIHISLHTHSKLEPGSNTNLFLQQIIKEDAHYLYGFYEKSERELFLNLISVSGIGPNTARMMLSSMNPEELILAITSENVSRLKSMKGIGVKTAQRVIIELKDKLIKQGIKSENIQLSDNTLREESLSALIMLGFSKKEIEKKVDSIISSNPSVSVEDLIKFALKQL